MSKTMKQQKRLWCRWSISGTQGQCQPFQSPNTLPKSHLMYQARLKVRHREKLQLRGKRRAIGASSRMQDKTYNLPIRQTKIFQWSITSTISRYLIRTASSPAKTWAAHFTAVSIEAIKIRETWQWPTRRTVPWTIDACLPSWTNGTLRAYSLMMVRMTLIYTTRTWCTKTWRKLTIQLTISKRINKSKKHGFRMRMRANKHDIVWSIFHH